MKVVRIVLTLLGAALFATLAMAAEKTPPKAKPQTACPITGEKINKKFYEDFEGRRVYFCCGDGPKGFKKDPAKYIKKLQDQGITLDETPSGKAKAEEKPHEGGAEEGHEHHHE